MIISINGGWEEPIIEERYGEAARTTLVLSFKKKVTLKSDPKKATLKAILQMDEIYQKMEDGQEYKLEEIGNLVGLKRTRTRDLLKQMIDDGRISTHGDMKSKRYTKRKN